MINISKWDFLCELSLNNWETSLETLKCLAQGKLSKSKENIAIIKIGDVNKNILEKSITLLNSQLQDREIKIFSKISEANKFGSILAVAVIGNSSVNDLEKINQQLNLYKPNFLGFIIYQ